MKNVEAVIKKWEAKSGPSSAGNNGGDKLGKKAWQDKFGVNLQGPQRQPSKYRPKKRKPKVIFIVILNTHTGSLKIVKGYKQLQTGCSRSCRFCNCL